MLKKYFFRAYFLYSAAKVSGRPYLNIRQLFSKQNHRPDSTDVSVTEGPIGLSDAVSSVTLAK